MIFILQTINDSLSTDVVRWEQKAMTTEVVRYLVQNVRQDIQVVTNFSESDKPLGEKV